jgi:hypothetical protein
MLSTLSSQSNGANVRPVPTLAKPAASQPNAEVVCDNKTVTNHAFGKWYFELAVNHEKVV